MADTWYALTWTHVLALFAVIFGIIVPLWLMYEYKHPYRDDDA